MSEQGKGIPTLDRPDQAVVVVRRWRRRKRFLIGLAFFLSLLTVVFRNPWFYDNFGVVERGRVFRSAQPEEELPGLVKTRGIASILNLRGGSLDDPFYVHEVQLAREQGIDFYDLPMSATRRPTRRQLLLLIDLFGRCRYPLLIHCKSGSDRTGLASGVYLMVQAGKSPTEALETFSVYYGHVPLWGTARLHEPFHEYDRWLQEHHVSHTPSRFRSWVEHDYRASDQETSFPPLDPGPRALSEHAASR